jgi:hypothetical protein
MAFGIKSKKEIQQVDIRDQVRNQIDAAFEEYGATIADKVIEQVQVKLTSLQLPEKVDDHPVAEKVEGLESEKAGSEVNTILFAKMPGVKIATKLSGFYTDLERKSGKPLSRLHKQRTSGISSSERKRYPYRKIDTILMELEADYVYEYAKSYVFKTK